MCYIFKKRHFLLFLIVENFREFGFFDGDKILARNKFIMGGFMGFCETDESENVMRFGDVKLAKEVFPGRFLFIIDISKFRFVFIQIFNIKRLKISKKLIY